MPASSAYSPRFSPSGRLNQQEPQLQQYTIAAMSARERERERARLSPEPRLEIMRPVSPFQNKRQFVHQQTQLQATSQTQVQREQRTYNSHYQTHSSAKPYTHAKQSQLRTQVATYSNTAPTTHSYARPGMYQSGPHARSGTVKGDSRGAWNQQRDTDISPALKMMTYDQGNGRGAEIASNAKGTLAPPERDDMNRSVSPDGTRRRNPGWRKPVPKYIPTPPSTPPTAVFERLPSAREARDREERVPPVPQTSNARSTYGHPVPVKAYTDPAPSAVSQAPSRPVRAATDYQVPVMFRDFTTNRDLAVNLESSHARIPTIQQPVQAYTHLRPAHALASSPKVIATGSRGVVKAPTSREQVPAAPYSQASTAPQAPPQAHTIVHTQLPLPLALAHSRSDSRPSDAKDEQQRDALAHPQPRKVPSMAQLVAMVLPSRTPSPKVAPPTFEDNSISSPSHPVPAPTHAVLNPTSQPTVPVLSVDPPSPAVDVQEAISTVVPRAFLQPHQVQLPPSNESSAKSSRSVSPEPAALRSNAPAPVRSRSRSPTPAIIPQYAPPPPPFPAPPPNTPISAPKQRVSAALQAQITSKLVEKVGATATEVSQRPHFQTDKASAEKHNAQMATHEQALQSEDSRPPAPQRREMTVHPAENIHASTFAQEYTPSSVALRNFATRETPAVTIPREEAPVSTPESNTAHSSRKMQQMKDNMDQITSTPAVNLRDSTRSRAHTPPSRGTNPSTTQEGQNKLTSAEERTVPVSVPSQNVHYRGSLLLDTRASEENEVKVEKRPAPIPMSDRSQVSRESGLATPPITPPGTIASMSTLKEEPDRTKKLEHDSEDQSTRNVALPVAHSRSAIPYSSTPAHVTKAVIRRDALIQDEQPTKDNEATIEGAKTNARPVTQFLASAKPVVTSNAAPEEPATPPATKLPSDWKETITRAVRSNNSPSPSLPLPSQAGHDESSSILPLLKPAISQSHAEKKVQTVPAEASVATELRSERSEHATMALTLHVHEVENVHVFKPAQSPGNAPNDTEKGWHVYSSRSPRNVPMPLDPPPATSYVIQNRTAQSLSPPIISANGMATEANTRNRSPVPRRKMPQQYIEATNLTQEKPDIEPTTVTETVVAPLSDSAPVPSSRRAVELSSRSHSPGSRKKAKASRGRTNNGERDASAIQSSENHPPSLSSGVSHADFPELKEPRLIAETESTNCISPPPRYQSLGNRKRLPLNGSDSSLVQPGDRDLTHGLPSSPPPASRSLSPTSQTQPLPKQSRHLHGQHKRLPALEVTQQTYRPPTPPIPSHYRKKRSNDMLPPEPPSFMKKAVHVIYPDTSTSHGHSLSNDSAFNKPNPDPENDNNCVEPSNAQSNKERSRPQSPAFSTPASEDQDEYETVESDAYPQVPPKGRRPEGHTRGFTTSDRQADYTIQHATRGQVRYPSAPVGEAKAHTLMLPPSSNSSRSRVADRKESSPSPNLRSRRGPQPHATKAARSHSEKVFRNKSKVHPVARSRSTPIPSSRQRGRRSFWQIFGLWARVFMAKFKTWASPSPSPSQSREYGPYYSTSDEY
ncbi:uncharacterized protein FOMMEDRAFT_158250 [Fomitiporia mediterranea MF3/22]|uniref:uncharacterized protein n=1 Tax=Fomitiporia mediterranea (strain MF3/22) TaxID=694068 RepID=UPI000440753E|nr:uncharacterized protein FOMMEDRAFT_158250 [Fomitiporia mediterranea MF3/22]EJD01115.1 hypothetical protein FOMMEDRAFT_158250 [Fomitiporia mediterranea MF3/22]